MVEVDYIDITPLGVDKDGKGQVGKVSTVFQETDWDQIHNNPNGLTKEGVLKKLDLWSKSVNKQLIIKYQTMLKQCRHFSKSGHTSDGKIIYSREVSIVKRDDGSIWRVFGEPKWTSENPDPDYFKSSKK